MRRSTALLQQQLDAALEEQVMRFVLPMTMFQQRTLSLRRQRLLATWATMKFIVGEFGASPPREPHFMESERRFLRRTLRPPGDVTVWLSAYLGPSTARYVDRPVNWKVVQTGQDTDAFGGLITMDRFLVTLFAHRLGPLVGPGQHFEIEVPFADAIVQVWPPISQQVAWPPGRGWDDDSIRLWSEWIEHAVGRIV
jgi:hypothetical protein